MKHLSIFVLTAALLPFSASAVNASDIAGKLLTGDKKYACEAIACLTSPGTPPKNATLHYTGSIPFTTNTRKTPSAHAAASSSSALLPVTKRLHPLSK